MLSWEGATERLYTAAAISKEEGATRAAEKFEKSCTKAARFHTDTARRSRFVSDLFSGKILKKATASLPIDMKSD